jgi:hypothetical protein
LRTNSAVTAVLIAVSLAGITAPATAHADFGDRDQPACTGPVPTPDQVAAIMNELTDPDIPAANKTYIVTPAFTDVITPGFTNRDDPAPSPGEPLPMPLPPGSQNVPPGVEVYAQTWSGSAVVIGAQRIQHTYAGTARSHFVSVSLVTSQHLMCSRVLTLAESQRYSMMKPPLAAVFRVKRVVPSVRFELTLDGF